MKTIGKILCISFMLLSMSAWALKPVTIKGKVDFANKGLVRVYVYEDLITYKRTQIQQADIKEDSTFSLQIQIEETQLIELAYNMVAGTLFVEPEKTYQLHLSADTRFLPYIDATIMGGNLLVKFDHVDTAELNYKIARFDRYYDYFCINYGEFLYTNMTQEHYDSLVNMLKVRFPDNYNPLNYYSTYIHYRYAELDRMFYSKNKLKIYNQYLTDNYIHYNNIAYMEFFNNFFDKYLYGTSKYIEKSMLYNNINNKRNSYRLLDALGKDPILVNEVIREMVLIKGLGEIYGNDEFSQENILFLLNQMTNATKFVQHKQMAENQIKQLTKLRPGSVAPNFEVKDVYRVKVTLDDYKGKYVFIHFFATYNVESIREMLILKDMYAHLKDSLEIVSVMLDFEYSKLYHFVNEYKDFDWTFVHCDGNFAMIDSYDAYSLPMGVLIDAKGKIIACPTKSVSDGLLMQIYTLFPAMEEKNKLEK